MEYEHDAFESDELWEEDGAPMNGSFESVLTPFLGYEVTWQPGRLSLVQPSTPESDLILIGVYDDCVILEGTTDYLVLPRESLVVSIPRDEWESDD